MPVLHLNLTSNNTNVKLNRTIKSQNLTLKYFSVDMNPSSFTDKTVCVAIPFISHDINSNEDSTGDNNGHLVLPRNSTTAFTASSIDLPISTSQNIERSFNVKIYEADGKTLATGVHNITLLFSFSDSTH